MLSPTAILDSSGQISLTGVDGQNVVWGNRSSVSDMTQIVGEP
jgi:hypothetical protein